MSRPRRACFTPAQQRTASALADLIASARALQGRHPAMSMSEATQRVQASMADEAESRNAEREDS